MVYRYALIQPGMFPEWINIRNLDHTVYDLGLQNGTIKYRTPYSAMIDDPYDTHGMDHGRVVKTTYAVTMKQIIGYNMLSVCRQMREEAIPIFYGENVFNFIGKSAAIAFIKDRCDYARESLRYFRFFFHLRKDGTHQRRAYELSRAFEYVARHAQLRTVELYVNDFDDCLKSSLKLGSKPMRWVRSFTKIRNLDTLKFEFEGAAEFDLFDDGDIFDTEFEDEMESDGGSFPESNVSNDRYLEYMDRIDDLKTYFECKMLKNRTEDDAKTAKEIFERHRR